MPPTTTVTPPIYVDVRDFSSQVSSGAWHDAINAAVTQANSAGGGKLWLSPSERSIAGHIVMKSNVTMELAPGATIKAENDLEIGDSPDTSERNGLFFFGGSVTNAWILGGHLDINSAEWTGNTGDLKGVLFWGANNCGIRDARVSNTVDDGVYAANGGSNLDVIGNRIVNAGRRGFACTDAPFECRWNWNRVENAGNSGCHISTGPNAQVIGNYFKWDSFPADSGAPAVDMTNSTGICAHNIVDGFGGAWIWRWFGGASHRPNVFANNQDYNCRTFWAGIQIGDDTGSEPGNRHSWIIGPHVSRGLIMEPSGDRRLVWLRQVADASISGLVFRDLDENDGGTVHGIEFGESDNTADKGRRITVNGCILPVLNGGSSIKFGADQWQDVTIGTNHLPGGIDYGSNASGTFEIGTNRGYKIRNSGSSTIADTDSSVTVAHGLDETPNSAIVTPQGDERLWVSAIDATNITVNRSGASGARDFYWHAEWKP